jgi:hypothetical protein
MAVLAFVIFFIATPFIGFTGDTCLPVCSSLGVAAGVLIITSIIMSGGRQHEVGPFCPACGRKALPILEQAAKSGVDQYTLSRVYHCTCGYSGPRLPYDGFWKFIDVNGPGLFIGTTLEKLAIHSYNIRHPDKPYR